MTPTAEVKPQRSVLVIFTQTTLLLEALATFFASLVVWGLSRADVLSVSPGLVWVAGSALAASFALASARASSKWGRWFGWALHAPLIAGGVLVPAIAFVGVMFLCVYAVGVRWGSRIDRERLLRVEAQGGAE
jgi:dolichyl-phosphate-mannose--protein O-mannosyl transferase